MKPLTSGVRDFYEANTRKFLLLGGEGALHRELWASGITSKAAALHYAHDLVLTELRTVNPQGRARVLDLGCGVGAAARFLVEHVPARVYAVSLSPRQIAIARHRAARRPCLGECSFHEADFCALPGPLVAEMQPIDLAFSIEAFVHAESVTAFFREASRALGPRGRLILVDDFLTRPGLAAQALEDVRSGWHMHSLLAVVDVAAAAASQGLIMVDSIDLSALQRLGRPRDRLVRACQPALKRARRFSPWAQSLVGGDALQRCHQIGLLNYRLIRFQKTVA